MTLRMTAVPELTVVSLRALISGDIGVVWHRGFFPPAECRRALPAIVSECERANYTLTGDFQSIGTSMGEASESANNAIRYIETARQTNEVIRNHIFAQRLSPIDSLRLILDELWPAGATVGRFEGRLMLPGIIRRWPTGGHANPHIDQRDTPLLRHYELRCRIGANIYLEVPPRGKGGQVDFWTLYDDEAAYDVNKREDYGLDRAQLGEPLWSAVPDQGDLLMFNARRVHGVRRVDSGSRVTAACFLGFRDDDDPLVLFA
jgi:2OG-Fe(II) oxygenase superfamily